MRVNYPLSVDNFSFLKLQAAIYRQTVNSRSKNNQPDSLGTFRSKTLHVVFFVWIRVGSCSTVFAIGTISETHSLASRRMRTQPGRPLLLAHSVHQLRESMGEGACTFIRHEMQIRKFATRPLLTYDQ